MSYCVKGLIDEAFLVTRCTYKKSFFFIILLMESNFQIEKESEKRIRSIIESRFRFKAFVRLTPILIDMEIFKNVLIHIK